MSDVIGEVVRFRVKPNAFLYAIEALRLFFVMAFVLALGLMPLAHLRTGLPIGGLMLRIVLAVYGTFSLFFFVWVVFLAHYTEFIVTNKRAIVRRALMRRASDKVSIPIGSIKTVEVRAYGARYGSVYLDWDEASSLDDSRSHEDSLREIPSLSRPASFQAVDRPRRLTKLVVRSGRFAAWLSLPSSSPPLSGFYGFKHFDAFAQLVLDLQSAA